MLGGDDNNEDYPDQRAIALVNAFIVHTAALLNNFAAMSESKLHTVHLRITDLDAQLRLLEAQVYGAELSHASEFPDPSSGKTPVEVAESSAPSTNGDSVEEIDLRNADLGQIVPRTSPRPSFPTEDRTSAFMDRLQSSTLAAAASLAGPHALQDDTGDNQ